MILLHKDAVSERSVTSKVDFSLKGKSTRIPFLQHSLVARASVDRLLSRILQREKCFKVLKCAAFEV